MENLKTQPKEKGSNPNFNYNFNFMVKLPIKDIYRQDMPCKVYDTVFSFGNPSLVGNFHIKISQIIEKDIVKRNTLKKKLKELREKLQGIK